MTIHTHQENSFDKYLSNHTMKFLLLFTPLLFVNCSHDIQQFQNLASVENLGSESVKPVQILLNKSGEKYSLQWNASTAYILNEDYGKVKLTNQSGSYNYNPGNDKYYNLDLDFEGLTYERNQFDGVYLPTEKGKIIVLK